MLEPARTRSGARADRATAFSSCELSAVWCTVLRFLIHHDPDDIMMASVPKRINTCKRLVGVFRTPSAKLQYFVQPPMSVTSLRR
eukprot:1387983-Prymnesium_polylepis.1